MKLLIVGDVHTSEYGISDAVEHAHENDVKTIIFLGDFGYTYAEEFLVFLESMTSRYGIEILFIDGNHDDHVFLRSFGDIPAEIVPGVTYTPRGSTAYFGGKKVLFIGGATSIDKQYRVPYVSWWPEEDITESDVQKCIEQGPVDVIMSHDAPWLPPKLPPLAINADVLADAKANRRRLKHIVEATEPRFLYHGHLHIRSTDHANMPWGDFTIESLAHEGARLRDNAIIVETGEW